MYHKTEDNCTAWPNGMFPGKGEKLTAAKQSQVRHRQSHQLLLSFSPFPARNPIWPQKKLFILKRRHSHTINTYIHDA